MLLSLYWHLCTLLSPYIKVCAGCCNKSVPKITVSYHHMICALSTKNGISSYFPEGTQVSKYQFGNVYYHFNSSCVANALPSSVCSSSLANTNRPSSFSSS